jgi:hypothetical protein
MSVQLNHGLGYSTGTKNGHDMIAIYRTAMGETLSKVYQNKGRWATVMSACESFTFGASIRYSES